MATFYETILATREAAEKDAKTTFGRGQIHNQLDIGAKLEKNLQQVKNSEKEVARLSRLPARLTSSRSDKIAAMRKLMLDQAYEQAYANKVAALQNPQRISSASTLVGNTELIYDSFKIKALFTDKEFELPDVKDLIDITEIAQEVHLENIPDKLQQKSYEVQYAKSISALEKNVTKAEKNVNSFRRHFRTQTQQQNAIKELDKARDHLEALKDPNAWIAKSQARDQEKAQEAKLEKAVELAAAEVETINQQYTRAWGTSFAPNKEEYNQRLTTANEALESRKAELQAFQQSRSAKPAESVPEKQKETGIKQPVTQETKNLFALGKDVEKAQKDVDAAKKGVTSFRRHFKSTAKTAIERLKDAEKRLEEAEEKFQNFGESEAAKLPETGQSKQAPAITHALDAMPPPPPLKPPPAPPPISKDTPPPDPTKHKPK